MYPLRLLLIILVPLFSFSQRSIKNWKEHPIPSANEIAVIESDGPMWYVRLNHKGMITGEVIGGVWRAAFKLPWKLPLDDPRYMRLINLHKVDNGYLFSYYYGKDLDELRWFSMNGDSSYTIAKLSVGDFITYNDTTYLVSTTDGRDGFVHKAIFENGVWTTGDKRSLGAASQVVLFDQIRDRYLIITSKGILQFRGFNEIETIKSIDFWNKLYPNSAVIKDDELYVGLRGGVYLYNLVTKQEAWLMPR